MTPRWARSHSHRANHSQRSLSPEQKELAMKDDVTIDSEIRELP